MMGTAAARLPKGSLLLGAVLLCACGGNATSPAPHPADNGRETAQGYARATRDLRHHFWNAAEHRIQPTQGNGGPNNGRVEPGQKATTFWQMAQYHKVLYGQWRWNRSAVARAAIADNWSSIRATYTAAQLREDGRDDQSISVSDDAGWKAAFLAQVHAVTKDPEALHALEEMIPTVTARFLDPNQPRLLHGKSPAGRSLYSNPHGILYAAQKDRHAYETYGRVSTLYEATLALAALYAYEQDGDPAYLSYALATYRWIHADLRNTKQSADDAATAIYLAELSLDPSALKAGRLEAKNRYYGKPVRALSAEYGGGTLAMAVLAARLYGRTHDMAYLDEARDIVAAFVRPDAFGRQRGATLLFVNARDPWTEGYWYPETVAEVLTLPGVDPSGTFRNALRNTAKAILSQRTTAGYYGADWSGPELDTANGVWTWLEESRRANDGRGGGQAAPDQIMTAANSTLLLQAAALP